MALGLSGSGLITGFNSASDGFGRVLQVVRATDGTGRNTSSTSFIDAGISVTITPQKIDSTIMIISSFFGACAGTVTHKYVSYRITDSGNNPISGAESFNLGQNTPTGDLQVPITLMGWVSTGSLSTETYKLQFKSLLSTTTNYIFNDSSTGQMFAIEVAA
jgi:hypothetical protein